MTLRYGEKTKRKSMCYIQGLVNNAYVKKEFISLAHAIDELKVWVRQGKVIRGMTIHTISTILNDNKPPYKIIDQN